MTLLFKVINDKIIVRGEKNVVFRFSNVYTFIICRNKWLRKYFNEEEKRIREYYR